MKEIWTGILAYNLIISVMVQVAELHEKKPRKMSFKLTLQLQLILSFRKAGIFSENNPAYLRFLASIVYK
jgi:hypothetical protein